MVRRVMKGRGGEGESGERGRLGVINITIHYSLFTIHYSLFTIHYPLSTIHYPLEFLSDIDRANFPAFAFDEDFILSDSE